MHMFHRAWVIFHVFFESNSPNPSGKMDRHYDRCLSVWGWKWWCLGFIMSVCEDGKLWKKIWWLLITMVFYLNYCGYNFLLYMMWILCFCNSFVVFSGWLMKRRTPWFVTLVAGRCNCRSREVDDQWYFASQNCLRYVFQKGYVV